MKELSELNAIYQKMSTPDVDEAMIVTNADKKGNTPAYQAFKAGKKNVKTGKPMYKAADHMKEEEVVEGKVNAGLQAYLDKKKGKKSNGDDKKEMNGNGNGNGKGSKGSKPDFLDLDKDGNKTEPMKSAAKSAKKEETEYNYVNQYIEMNAPRMQKGAMAYDGPNKAASVAKYRVMAKTKSKRTVTIDKPDKLVSMKVMTPKESFDKMIESGKFSDQELARIAEVTGIVDELI